MKYLTLSLGVVAFSAATCLATKGMPFQNVDRYIERAEQVLVVKCVHRLLPSPHEDGKGYKVEVLRALKGKVDRQTITVISVFNDMDAGQRYLVFAFGKSFGREVSLIDNGLISPLPIPTRFDLRSLTSGDTKVHVLRLFSERRKHIASLVADLEKEKATLELALSEGH